MKTHGTTTSRLAPNTVSRQRFLQAVHAIADEVWDFHNRWGFGSGMFDGNEPSSIVTERRAILDEEVREMLESAAQGDEQGVCDEAADVLFVALGHAEALGEKGIAAMQRIAAKNARKTDKTHAIREDTGKLLPKEGKPHKWQ